ncbi:methyltransferase domain-containing protein [Roseivirga sp. BDSF3-8]|uniref:methyltransferase domain-containing protein n=1 Tax=Roseivirga sp. BDSF3-8 TaxID=3241598 RepID=UPI0035323640
MQEDIQNLDSTYWTNRYDQQETQWDVGTITPPLKAYFDQLDNKDIYILIPGAGNAYEAEYLHEQGFRNVQVVDVSAVPLKNLKYRAPSFPDEHLILKDFFDLEGSYDLIVEQTFFCALNPALRTSYAEKMNELLRPGGKLAGVLFEDTLFTDHPPFGGFREEYEGYFKSYFDFLHFERCKNSLPPRQNRELFIELQKPVA